MARHHFVPQFLLRSWATDGRFCAYYWNDGAKKVIDNEKALVASACQIPDLNTFFGVPKAELRELVGGDATYNASILRDVLEGQRGARRDIVVVNAAAGLLAAGLAKDLFEGVAMAEKSIDSHAALAKLEALRKQRSS